MVKPVCLFLVLHAGVVGALSRPSEFPKQARTGHLPRTWARSPIKAPRVAPALEFASAAAKHGFASLLVVTSLAAPAPGLDSVRVGECILQNCAPQLARCIADPECAANIVCLNLCNGKKDETACEIRCGDQFENKVVDEFNSCAVSNKKCVPQEKDKGQYPVPPPGATVEEFDTNDFTGTWYISAGQNKLFDTFPCQKHEFSSPEPGTLVGNLKWRVRTSYGAQLERSAEQRFVQDERSPGILYNHDNEFLHYQDDWYILAQKPDEYVFVYYRGTNDAWDGYGGAVVYTRSKTLPSKYIPELRDACKKVPGLNWEDFVQTDNSCPRVTIPTVEDELEKDAKILRLDIEELESDAELGLFGIPREIQKEVSVLEEDIAEEVTAVERFFGKLVGRAQPGP